MLPITPSRDPVERLMARGVEELPVAAFGNTWAGWAGRVNKMLGRPTTVQHCYLTDWS